MAAAAAVALTEAEFGALGVAALPVVGGDFTEPGRTEAAAAAAAACCWLKGKIKAGPC